MGSNRLTSSRYLSRENCISIAALSRREPHSVVAAAESRAFQLKRRGNRNGFGEVVAKSGLGVAQRERWSPSCA
jgi:hypothetical protein